MTRHANFENRGKACVGDPEALRKIPGSQEQASHHCTAPQIFVAPVKAIETDRSVSSTIYCPRSHDAKNCLFGRNRTGRRGVDGGARSY